MIALPLQRSPWSRAGRLRRPAQLRQARAEPRDAIHERRWQPAVVDRLARHRREPSRTVELRPRFAGSVRLGQPADRVVPVEAERGSPRQVQRGEAAPERLLRRGSARTRLDPLEGQETRPRPLAHRHHRRRAQGVRGGEPGEALGLGTVRAGGRIGVVLDEDPAPVGEPGLQRAVDAAARDRRRIDDRRPGRRGERDEEGAHRPGGVHVRRWAIRPALAASVISNTSANPSGPP